MDEKPAVPHISSPVETQDHVDEDDFSQAHAVVAPLALGSRTKPVR